MADVPGADPLRRDLCRLAAFLEASEVRLFIAGGYGLILKAEYLRENELRTVAPTPFPRATTDLDVVLSADVIADASKMAAVQEGLERMEYEPVLGRENYQWSRVVEFGGRDVTMKFDLLGQIPPDTAGLSVRPRRMRPHGFTGLHAHPAEEAEFIHEESLTIDVCGSGKSGRVEIPHPFNYLLLKLYAFDDRKEDEDVDYGRHHAFDVYRIVAMLTEEEWDGVGDLRRSHADPHAIQEKVNVVVDHFHDRVAHRIGGKAKAMIVTRSRKHCVRYHRSLEHLESQLTRDAGLEASVKANTKENVRLTFEQKVENHFDEMAESNFKLLKRIVDDRRLGAVLVDRLFERFWRMMREGEDTSAGGP